MLKIFTYCFQATLKVDNSQRIMILGQSKDLGTCRSTKKNGDKCTAFVNVNHCEYCIYHIKQEYQKCSRRSELQSTFAGAGLTALRNKVLGKNEVFYAGKSYTAIKPSKSRKLIEKDEGRLKALSGVVTSSVKDKKRVEVAKITKRAAVLEATRDQRKRDAEILQRLGSSDQKSIISEDKNIVSEVSSGKIAAKENVTVLKTKQELKAMEQNQPSDSLQKTNMIDLSAPVSKRFMDRAKFKALVYVQKNGPIKKVDPNNIRGQKRASSDTKESHHEPKRLKKIQNNEFYSERFKKMMQMSSKNADLLERRDDEQREKYFEKMEMKERLEEKMLNTFKVPCKAVTCLKCKYTSFSAAEHCKTERHPLKVTDGTKRFFKCSDCGHRTTCLEVVPVKPCGNCSGGKWERTAMIKERMVKAPYELSIRGGEQKFVNSVVSDPNVNLLVPED